MCERYSVCLCVCVCLCLHTCACVSCDPEFSQPGAQMSRSSGNSATSVPRGPPDSPPAPSSAELRLAWPRAAALGSPQHTQPAADKFRPDNTLHRAWSVCTREKTHTHTHTHIQTHTLTHTRTQIHKHTHTFTNTH